MSDGLKADLATVGGADVQLAGATQPKVEFVSARERGESMVPAPKATAVSRAPAATHGSRAPVKSVHHETPAASAASVQSQEVVPAEMPKAEPAPEPIQSQGRPGAPMPSSTQREPRGGWKTPGQIIRNAPFPINP